MLCAAALAGVLAVGRLRPDADSVADRHAAPARPRDNARCRDCHRQVWDEWQQSFHSKAWSDPNVQAAFQHFGHDRKCESCHAPVSVFQTGLTAEVQLRSEARDSGVDCLACHELPDGRIAARRTLPDAPCRPVATPELAASSFCGACHVAIYRDWEQSAYAQSGTTCQRCHRAPEAEDAAGASHRWRGGHDDDWVRFGAEMACRRQGEKLVVTVRNHATGHNYPGERHNRILLVQVLQRQADGRITLAQQAVIKDITPFRGESSAERIRPGATFQAEFPVVEPPVTAEVRLLYKRFPWQSDEDALSVHRQEIELK